ncbi:MAG: sigma-54-dependent Fis family transcriptional regulator, partial [Deltaproteobacteria bacterium]|nr:sigma-54-dependent Fis family transcriptional regulator [Deltaproteobacteria bacterium]
GSFTGADRPKKGLIEVAHGGTLFLDEVGELTPKMQVDLLRVLQEKTFYRVGGVEPIRADFRLVSATNRDLTQEIHVGTFRQDFFYRINVITLRMPALRDRKDDISLLANYFLKRVARETNRPVDSISDQAMQILVEHDWPGNIRELQNVVERAVVTSKKRIITPEAFAYLYPDVVCVAGDSESKSLKHVEMAHIRRVLDEEDWNISRAAKVLDLDRTTLHKKIKKYGLKPQKSTAL